MNKLLCSSFRPDSCGYASGSESEAGDDSGGEAAQQRRLRTKFTSAQISRLESTFSKHKYLGATRRRKVAEKLNLSETQVGLSGNVALCPQLVASVRFGLNVVLCSPSR